MRIKKELNEYKKLIATVQIKVYVVLTVNRARV